MYQSKTLTLPLILLTETAGLRGAPSLHLTAYGTNKVYWDINEFIAELEMAFEQYATELKEDSALQLLAIQYYDRYSIIWQTQ